MSVSVRTETLSKESFDLEKGYWPGWLGADVLEQWFTGKIQYICRNIYVWLDSFFSWLSFITLVWAREGEHDGSEWWEILCVLFTTPKAIRFVSESSTYCRTTVKNRRSNKMITESPRHPSLHSGQGPGTCPRFRLSRQMSVAPPSRLIMYSSVGRVLPPRLVTLYSTPRRI